MKHYSSIDDLPIYNWNKIHETGELKYLLHDYSRKITTAQLNQLPEIWRMIYDEYIQRFGIGETSMAILDRERRIAELQIERIETGDENIQTFIEIETVALDRKKAETEYLKVDFYETKAYIEKHLGFMINPKICTVVEFYNYIKTLENRK